MFRIAVRRLNRCASTSARRVVVVTGGSKGIGLGITEAFLKDGAIVVSLDSDSASNTNLVSKWAGSASGFGQVVALNTDVSDVSSCKQAVDAIFQQFGSISLLVSNAGIQPPSTSLPIHALAEATWNRILAVNLSATYHLSKLVLPHMVSESQRLEAQGLDTLESGGIIIVSSVHGLQTSKGTPAYAASKGALLALTRQLALEYGEYGIRVNAINPGTIRTPLVTGQLKAVGSSFEDQGKLYPLQSRCGFIHEIGEVAVFLASRKASFITGEFINVDGGIMAKGSWAV